MREGKWEKANDLIEQQLLHDPANPYLNFLNGLAYERQAQTNGNLAVYAEVAYLLCLRHDPNFAPAATRLGLLYYRMRRFGEAFQLFRQALIYEPENVSLALLAATSGYLARAPEESAQILESIAELADDDPEYLRNAVLIYAAAGKDDQAQEALTRYRKLPAGAVDVGYLEQRLGQWQQLRQQQEPAAAPDAADEPPTDGAQETNGDVPDIPRMATVEIVILQVVSRTTSRTGVNLLDGLRAQLAGNSFTYADTATRIKDFAAFPSPADTRQTTSTLNAGVTLPTITYDLNIFNRGDAQTKVLAHPTLLLTDGKEAGFEFANTLYIAIASQEDVELDEITAGLTLKITPTFLTDDLLELETYAQLDHFINLAPGTFVNKAGTEATTLTVDPVARIGQTVVLSGLAQTFSESHASKTPVLGQLPVVRTLFREADSDELQSSVIILMTPRPAAVSAAAVVASSEDIQDPAFFRRVTKLTPATANTNGPDLADVRQFRRQDVVVDRRFDSEGVVNFMIDRAVSALLSSP